MKVPLMTVKSPEEVTPESWTAPLEIGRGLHRLDGKTPVVPFLKPRMKVPLTTVKLPEGVTGVRFPDPESWTVPLETRKGIHWMDVKTTCCSSDGIKYSSYSSCSNLHLNASSYIDYGSTASDNKMIPIATNSISQHSFNSCLSRNNSSSVIHGASGPCIPNGGNDTSLIYKENKNHDIPSPTKSDSSRVIAEETHTSTIKQEDETTIANSNDCDDICHFCDKSRTSKNNESIVIANDTLLNEKNTSCGELNSNTKRISFNSEPSKRRDRKNSLILPDLESGNLYISKPKRIKKKPCVVCVKSRVILRPRLSFVALIRESIMASPEKQLSLQGIYKYIVETYEYYRHCGSGWKNSVRHNLSLNKCFFKPRKKGEVAKKGSNWHYDSSCDQHFQNNNFSRRIRMKRCEKKSSIESTSYNSSTSSTFTTSVPRTYSHPYSHQYLNYSHHFLSQSYHRSMTSSNKDWSLAHISQSNQSSISAYSSSQRMPVEHIDPSASATVSHAYAANNYSYGLPTTAYSNNYAATLAPSQQTHHYNYFP